MTEFDTQYINRLKIYQSKVVKSYHFQTSFTFIKKRREPNKIFLSSEVRNFA